MRIPKLFSPQNLPQKNNKECSGKPHTHTNMTLLMHAMRITLVVLRLAKNITPNIYMQVWCIQYTRLYRDIGYFYGKWINCVHCRYVIQRWFANKKNTIHTLYTYAIIHHMHHHPTSSQQPPLPSTVRNFMRQIRPAIGNKGLRWKKNVITISLYFSITISPRLLRIHNRY